MKKILPLLFIFSSMAALAQLSTDKNRILYGPCVKDSLQTGSFSSWFNPGYENYIANSAVLHQLKNINCKDITIEIFFGTWCGDSKREVPRFLRLLSDFSFPIQNTKLIAVGGNDSLVKQSPAHEEAGKGILRVPTIIIYKKGIETGRINEYPVYSLEKDLLTLLRNEPYDPNYQSFSLLRKWLADSTLLDDNCSTAGLAGILRSAVKNEHELNSAGYLMLKQGRRKEALRIFQINYALFPESSNTASSLGEGYYENGDYKKAVLLLERSLDLDKNNVATKEILEVLYKAKEKEKS